MSDFSHQLATSGLSGESTTRIISGLNDRLTARIIELTARQHRLPPVPWCWLALGSEGRHEQSLVSDQDNGLVFSATDRHEADALRELFLPFAQDVNRRLADCGFPLCSGGIMAGNPAWCLSLEEWRQRFYEWVRRPEPEALLNASIFFDFRPLYGREELVADLQHWLLRKVKGTLVPTARARAVTGQPRALVGAVLGRLPLGKGFDAEAGWFALLGLAALAAPKRLPSAAAASPGHRSPATSPADARRLGAPRAARPSSASTATLVRAASA